MVRSTPRSPSTKDHKQRITHRDWLKSTDAPAAPETERDIIYARNIFLERKTNRHQGPSPCKTRRVWGKIWAGRRAPQKNTTTPGNNPWPDLTLIHDACFHVFSGDFSLATTLGNHSRHPTAGITFGEASQLVGMTLSGVTIRFLHEFDYCVFFLIFSPANLLACAHLMTASNPYLHLITSFLTSLIGWAQVQPRSDHHACFLMKASPTML